MVNSNYDVMSQVFDMMEYVNTYRGEIGLDPVEVEYASMQEMNVKADHFSRDSDQCHLEEFYQGEYNIGGFIPTKTTLIELYFFGYIDPEDEAYTREDKRDSLETNLVMPFLKALKSSSNFDGKINFGYPPPKFDANEVGIMLVFSLKQNICIR